jgi:hypothetical protein
MNSYEIINETLFYISEKIPLQKKMIIVKFCTDNNNIILLYSY